MTSLRMPSLGADMDEATLVEWLVAPGQEVHRGDVVAVVDTAKAAMEIESFEDAVVGELLVEPGTRVPVGAPLAVLSSPSTSSTPEPPASPIKEYVPPIKEEIPPPPATPTPARPPTPPQRRRAQRLGGAAAVESAAPLPSRARVSPRARRLAAELGVDPESLRGTGHAGAVVGADVQAAAKTSLIDRNGGADKGTAMRRTIGALMARSKREIPHYYLSTTVDLSRAAAHVASVNAGRPVSQRLVPAALMLKAAAVAARTVPQLNGWWVDDAFVPAEHVHLGVAVALRTGGLIAPAIHDADTLAVDELMAALRDVVRRSRGGRLRGSELTVGTLTVTNLGDRGVEAVFGVIYPPQVALVGFGRVVERPWAVEGMLTVRPVVTVTLSADHRATDGHVGGLYLEAVEHLLSTPEEL